MHVRDPWLWISLAGTAGHLMLALLVVKKRATGSVATPLALLLLDFFVWNVASLTFDLTGELIWHQIDVAFSPLGPPLALFVVLVFVRRLVELRWLLITAFAWFGLLSLIVVLGMALPEIWVWRTNGPWGTLFLVGILGVMTLCVWLLALHVRRSYGASEKARARLVLAAIVVGGALGSTVFWDDVMSVPPLASLGSFGSAGLLTIAVLRLRLFGRDLSVSTALYSLVLAALAAWAYLVVVRYLATHAVSLIAGLAIVTLALFVAIREVVVAAVVRRERRTQFQALGRLAYQMGHDLKNPLAALKGAVDFLLEERAQGRSLDPHGEFLELIAQQARRLAGVIEVYEGLSQLEPILVATDVNALVGDVLSLQRYAGHRKTAIETDLAGDLPPCRLDPDLIGSALENLVKNAFEAMPAGGTLTVSTAATELSGQQPGITVMVEDTGVGMDTWQRQQALESFFTTKSDGTGLGLAQVRRVVEAHQGELALESQVGRGTAVCLRLPVDPTPEQETSR